MLEIAHQVALRVGEESLDVSELGRLLRALEADPRVGTAAQALGISYRGAWGKLVRAERLFGVALVERTKGHGSRLTEARTSRTTRSPMRTSSNTTGAARTVPPGVL